MEAAFAAAIRRLGIEVVPVKLHDIFEGKLGRLSYALPRLPLPPKHIANRNVLQELLRARPDCALFWRPTHITPATLEKLKSAGIKIISYNNDDPFSPLYKKTLKPHIRLLWYEYHRCLPLFDKNFFYRPHNIAEARSKGVKHADLLLAYFVPERNFPFEFEAGRNQFEADVVFVGHFENDGRLELVDDLIKAKLNVRIWGDSRWNEKLSEEFIATHGTIIRASGEDYCKAISGAKIALVFLSKLNRDVYTRRCFEIPAIGTLMLAERTSFLEKLFLPDVEACFFSTAEEALTKINNLLANECERKRIADAGRIRVWEAGHDIDTRARLFVEQISID